MYYYHNIIGSMYGMEQFHENSNSEVVIKSIPNGIVASPAFIDSKWHTAILSHVKSGVVLKLWHVNADSVDVM